MNTYMKLGLVTVSCDYGYVNQAMSYITYYSAFTLWTGRHKEKNCYSCRVMWIKLNHMNDRKISYLLTLPFTIPSYKNLHCFKNLTSSSSTQISMLWSTSLQWVIRSHILQKSCLQMKHRTGYNKILFQDKRYCTNGSWWNVQN